MAEGIPARLTAAQGRRFGVTVGSAFIVIALILWFWRDARVVPAVFASIGSLFVAGGLLLPTRMGPVERGWMKLAHLISRITTPILMGIIYFVVLSPAGMVRRMFGRNALLRKPGTPGLVQGSYWFERSGKHTRSDLSRQF